MESCLPGRPSLRNSPGGGRGQIPGAADNGEALVREVPGAGDTDALQRHRQPHILRFRDTLPLERKKWAIDGHLCAVLLAAVRAFVPTCTANQDKRMDL